ncbi:hypothetical protein DSCW_17990 [Desulfosarcina widdelii]|uniref:Uncharacterized protein n=1 Tax=Desulfosarcina widdelii TaxID=947919 RepID=A0A5K7YX82_9BACT|nr:hypothetical protein [Desulfosarcina widdelii]BBO74382.1 hypothetical protein DSCW_17990 [Desulfosarcina widdelii]
MKKALFTLILLVMAICVTNAWALPPGDESPFEKDGTGYKTKAGVTHLAIGTTYRIGQCTVATLPTSPTTGDRIEVTDGDGATDCTVGGGSDVVTCRWSGSAWVSVDTQAAGSAEVQDEAFTEGNFNADTTHAVSQDDLWDLWLTLTTTINGLDLTPTGTWDLSGATVTFGLEAGDIPDLSGSYDAAGTAAAAVAALQADDLVTLSGVAIGSTHLGEFNGSTIDDNLTIKAALQALETAVEGAGGSDTTLDGITAEITGMNNSQILIYDGVGDSRIEAVSVSGAISILQTGVTAMATGAAIGDTAFTDLTPGNSYTNFGDADDDTLNELIEAIDDSWPSGSGAPTDATYLTSEAEAGLSAENVVSANGLSLVTAADYATMAAIAGFETALEGVLDLADLQGAVTDAQVPDDITIWNSSTDPYVILNDSDGAGSENADKEAGGFWANFITTTEDSEDSDIWATYMSGGTRTTAWLVDQSDAQMEIKIDLNLEEDLEIATGKHITVGANQWDNGSDKLDGAMIEDDGVGPDQMASGAYDLGTSLEVDTLTEGGNAVPNSTDFGANVLSALGNAVGASGAFIVNGDGNVNRLFLSDDRTGIGSPATGDICFEY